MCRTSLSNVWNPSPWAPVEELARVLSEKEEERGDQLDCEGSGGTANLLATPKGKGDGEDETRRRGKR